MGTKIIQCNLNRSWEAYNLLVHQAAELGTDVCVIAEPSAAHEAGNWFRSNSGLAAVVWMPKGSARLARCILVKRGHDFVIVEAGGLRIASCYVSPQTRKGPFLQFLDELGDAVREIGVTRVIVSGDFNARSRTWDERRPNFRGDLLEEWAAENDNRLINEDVASKIVRWKVSEAESLSDHKYIVYGVGTPPGTGQNEANRRRYDRWKFGKLDEEVFQSLWDLRCGEGGTEGNTRETTMNSARWLQRTMKEACDLAAPRASTRKTRQKAYWWNKDIAEAHSACIRARRLLTRKARKKEAGKSEESRRELAGLRRAYRERVRTA